MFGLPDNLIKQFEQAPLLRSHELGVADNVDKEHIGDLKLNFLLNLHGHGGEFYSVTSEGSTSFFRREGGDDLRCGGRRAACDNLLAVAGLLFRSRHGCRHIILSALSTTRFSRSADRPGAGRTKESV